MSHRTSKMYCLKTGWQRPVSYSIFILFQCWPGILFTFIYMSILRGSCCIISGAPYSWFIIITQINCGLCTSFPLGNLSDKTFIIPNRTVSEYNNQQVLQWNVVSQQVVETSQLAIMVTEGNISTTKLWENSKNGAENSTQGGRMMAAHQH